MSEDKNNYLRCVCHDRLYSVGITNLELRQDAVHYVVGGGVSVVRDLPNGVRKLGMFDPKTTLRDVIEAMF